MKKNSGIPILNSAKKLYQISGKNIDSSGKLFFENQLDLRKFVLNFNKGKDFTFNRALAATPAEFNGLIIISGVLENIIKDYIKMQNPDLANQAKRFLIDEIGEYKLDTLEKDYHNNFVSNDKQDFWQETLLIWLINQNSAIIKYRELFSDDVLKTASKYPLHFDVLKDFFPEEATLADKNLINFILEPFIMFPDSIFSQLDYIKENWQEFIGNGLLDILEAIGFFNEEQKAHFSGAGPTHVHDFNDDEYEKFTLDKEWMPNLILMAKSSYVWLEQLSRKYKRKIERLDEIPFTELELQASRGISGIWLIGIWQRSSASKKIKLLNGDVDAIASAYSLEDYKISDDIGGEEALDKLKKSAAKVGIRIGCDMVPNHTGLDSNWIVEHPDWFLQLDYSPFPAYSFTGENLSNKSEIELRIEDHYYDKTDAAVVFQYKKGDDIRYIYHGNDGTSTPWNDTAQLNYLLPEVRQAVSDKIIEIAKKFPIIRFDAAMTLAKKHVQRLWFPQPGSGGDIASRSEFGISKEKFDLLFPKEFWREVVDRVAIEAPDTLLLAEAFWMMEGYFVRTLGMHRVYNSAFMHMLKNEENAKYRKSIFNILEFNPEILKRFVNFMSNPDEDTAVAQFGKGDKYFGVCVLMSTMPGLPMYAHGQIEGFTERYGMEFKKAKWQENEDEKLIARHNREIFPLLNKRYLFSEVENFVLYDFTNDENIINENVFAYSNKQGSQHSLVVFHNKYQNCSGWINWANIPIKTEGETTWIRQNLGTAWLLHKSADYFLIYKDEISGLEYIRNSLEFHEKGLYQDLGAYKYAIFLKIMEVKDDADGHYAKLARYLQGGGVESVQQALKRLELLPLLENFHQYYNKEILLLLLEIKSEYTFEDFRLELASRNEDFLIIMKKRFDSNIDVREISNLISADLSYFFQYQEKNVIDKREKITIITWILLRYLGKFSSENDYAFVGSNLIKELFFGDIILQNSLEKIDLEMLKIAIQIQNWCLTEKPLNVEFKKMVSYPEIENLLQINRYDNITWFKKEAFEKLVIILKMTAICSIGKDKSQQKRFELFMEKLSKAEKVSGYQLEKLIKFLQ